MAVIHAQAVRKSRRETPLDWACSQMVGRELVDIFCGGLGWFKFLFALTFCRGQKNQSNLAIL